MCVSVRSISKTFALTATHDLIWLCVLLRFNSQKGKKMANKVFALFFKHITYTHHIDALMIF